MEPTWIAAGAAIISSFAAIWSARNGNRTLKRAEVDSQARSRPMVTAELRTHHLVEKILLIIRNHGPSVARNVTVKFDPEIPNIGMGEFLNRRYSRTIPVLTPGTELDNVYFTPANDHWRNLEGLPNRVTVTISYDGPNNAHYEDTYIIDVDIFDGRTFVSRSDRDPSERLKVIGQQLKEIKQVLRATELPPGWQHNDEP